MATPMIPQSVSKGEATPHSDPQQPNPPLASPTQTALNRSNSFISTPQACTLSRWRGSVSDEKPKQASFQPSPSHPVPAHTAPAHTGPNQSFPRDYPPLVVGRGLSSASEAKTDSDQHGPTQTSTDQSRSTQTHPDQPNLSPSVCLHLVVVVGPSTRGN